MVNSSRPPLRYRYWTRDELIAAVRGIEEGLSTGAASVGYSAAGTVSYVTRDNAMATLRDLYNRIDQLEGLGSAPVVRRVRMLAVKGY
ncbi:hypothetical protein Sa4125_30180 [Aureimonas sp. SA4125]|uniref:hypothetical protein n=1 Tax=Aureimonas sp. SA4125 TaxID=2826993 RepID=UPI001CC5F462|nr:hypothetical protein [Aureimonas sp. SA4125]BDA85476.1 hypothetical protein Sa4125_30180 [Aureimonas sp. SA4125]